ncbi:LysR family transcriptional regulator [Zoogloea sp. LCSB751]|uniref:LysR family transcriptional regulator n=1 Tax=Zoogloea sp. LCSB751 TaxID=1965277 RepID=UPI0009A4B509|nr:LysR family transcriptional regulator [Zoogloea sp. LCSB751]
MDRLHAMEVFVRVAEAGSFTAAADHLGLARSAVTRQIAALEAHLGVKLIARSTRSLKLTSAGLAYLERSREILDLVGVAESDLAGGDRRPRGPIRVSVPMSFGVRHLVPLVADFVTTYPEVSLDMDFDDRQVNLIESGLDLAIRITTQLDPTQVARRLSVARMVTLASPAYLERHGCPQKPEDLLAHQCLGYTGTAKVSWPYLVDEELIWVPVRCRLQANSGDALVDMAQRGLGICRQPSFIAAPAIQAGLLTRILVDFPGPELGIYAVFPSNRYVPSRVRALADYLAERIGPVPYWDQSLP